MNLCLLGGVVAGAAAGAAVGGEAAGALVGAGTGAVMSQLACGQATMAKPMMKDSDGDGVPDDKDKCPNTRKGLPVDANGCPIDSDHDGVPNHEDICPNTPQGVAVDKNGCPLDADGDGVPDYLDKCPNTPKGEKVDAKGCPMAGEKLAIVVNINFDFDKSTLRPDSIQKLQGVLKTLEDNPKMRVRVVGYTDSVGTAQYNMGLSVRRAEAVRAYLAKHGIDSSRLVATGKGEADPLVDNRTRAGRAVNRRVEFEVLGGMGG